MDYMDLKNKLTGMFDAGKLQAAPGEWGFFNETQRAIRRVGYATNLTGEIIQRAGEAKVDFLLTHHDSWESPTPFSTRRWMMPDSAPARPWRPLWV